MNKVKDLKKHSKDMRAINTIGEFGLKLIETGRTFKIQFDSEKKLNFCNRCFYQWSTSGEEPKTCASCRSPYWNKDRIRQEDNKDVIKDSQVFNIISKLYADSIYYEKICKCVDDPVIKKLFKDSEGISATNLSDMASRIISYNKKEKKFIKTISKKSVMKQKRNVKTPHS